MILKGLAPSHQTLQVFLVVTLKHLPVLSGDWLEPHPNLDVPGWGVGARNDWTPRLIVTILLRPLSTEFKGSQVSVPHPL